MIDTETISLNYGLKITNEHTQRTFLLIDSCRVNVFPLSTLSTSNDRYALRAH